jgi:hypothetical protein
MRSGAKDGETKRKESAMDGQGEFLSDADGCPDLSKYQSYLDGLEVTPEQKRELLESLWSIMCAFADFGFGIEPTQLICGWIEEARAHGAEASSGVVQSKKKPTQRNFNTAASTGGAGKESA